MLSLLETVRSLSLGGTLGAAGGALLFIAGVAPTGLVQAITSGTILGIAVHRLLEVAYLTDKANRFLVAVELRDLLRSVRRARPSFARHHYDDIIQKIAYARVLGTRAALRDVKMAIHTL